MARAGCAERIGRLQRCSAPPARARAAILRCWAARLACWRFLMALGSGFASLADLGWRRCLDGDGWPAQRGDFRRGDVGAAAKPARRLVRAAAGDRRWFARRCGFGLSRSLRSWFRRWTAGISAGGRCVASRRLPDLRRPEISAAVRRLSLAASCRLPAAKRSLRLQRGDRLGFGRRRGGRRLLGRLAGDVVLRLLREPACRRAASPAPASWLRPAARTSPRERRAMTGCWRIPRGPRAATPPRQVRRPGSTSTTRSRRTENGSRGALTRIPPSRDILRRPLSHRERGDHYTGRVRDAADTPARANQAGSRIPQRFRGAC